MWEIKEARGAEALEFLGDLARLRMEVFQAYPYLYEGDLSYEERYLSTYFSSPNSFVALCIAGANVVGASTAIPLDEEEDSFKKPFRDLRLDPAEICYYGESVLLADFRGQGIGKRFMEHRERFALSLKGMEAAAFCAVIRPDSHPMKPEGYKSLEGFWEKSGFRKLEGAITEYSWKDIGAQAETPKQMQFWMKKIR